MKSVVLAALLLLAACPLVAQEDCFGPDRHAASTNWDEHYDWAERHDPAALKGALDSKLRLLFSCRWKSDSQLADVYADLSVVVAHDVPNAACFKGDSGTVSLDRSRHRRWAGGKNRNSMLEAADWKILAAVDCLDPHQQPAFYADVSVVMAGGTLRAGQYQDSEPPSQDFSAEQDCFGPDRRAASTNWDRHYDWAQRQDAAHLKNALDYKMKLVFTCQMKAEQQLSDLYADMSVVVAHYARSAGCFKADDGSMSVDRSRHRRWASGKNRAALLEAMEAKAMATVDCIDPSRQPNYYADLSVILAGGSLDAGRRER